MRWVGFLICCGLLVVATRAQTTRSTDLWADRVEALAKALVHPIDGSDFRSAIVEDATIRGLDGSSAQYSQLATSATDGEVITARGYQMPASSIAADIAADFSSANSIPDDVRRVMIPPGEKEMRQANDVAIHWLSQTLNVSDGQHIGVIILRGKPSTTQPSDSPDEKCSLIMILVKGDISTDGKPQLTHVMFGDPRAVMK